MCHDLTASSGYSLIMPPVPPVSYSHCLYLYGYSDLSLCSFCHVPVPERGKRTVAL